MHIFIDESGTFTRSQGANNVSVVGALTIPNGQLARVERHYQSIRRDLPKDKGEVKGRGLNEAEIARVVTMLVARDVIFECSAMDLSFGTDAETIAHQTEQARKITEGLKNRHKPPAMTLAHNLRSRLEAIPPQLYAQSLVTFSLIARVLDHSTLFYAQRRPVELGAFHWVVDAKERSRTIDWEDWWSYMVMPWLQSHSVKNPSPMLIGADYSHYSRFDMEVPDYLAKATGLAQGRTVVNIKKVMTESFRFSANPEIGLELVDILTNATRRALVGNLKIEGWGRIPQLMIHTREQNLHLISIGEVPHSFKPAYASVIRHFGKYGRTMLKR